jgi:hypothetical protein
LLREAQGLLEETLRSHRVFHVAQLVAARPQKHDEGAVIVEVDLLRKTERIFDGFPGKFDRALVLQKNGSSDQIVNRLRRARTLHRRCQRSGLVVRRQRFIEALGLRELLSPPGVDLPQPLVVACLCASLDDGA